MNRVLKTVISVFMISFILLIGCTGKQNSEQVSEADASAGHEETTVTLNKRQIEILREEGLPENYEELGPKQKRAIIAIEELLSYADKKYSTSFHYLGYVMANGIEEEHVLAYADGCDPRDEVTIARSRKDGVYEYHDNYENLLIQPIYHDAISKFIKQTPLEEHNYKIFASVNGTVGNLDKEKPLKYIRGEVWVIFDDTVSEEDLKSLAESYAAMAEDEALGVPSHFVAAKVDTDTLKNISPYKFLDAVKNSPAYKSVHCTVSASGKAIVF